ncbi:hypothetical protein FFLO_03876 [Filobasidium floriforme]|uniref:Peptidyl-prolyl cis-trans isomerase-like 2 n=1 Tax=Filobasidium floriforme TaxID=5210 RepID=A0A8K0NPU0_9TREE|nr:uncharacterized protein HD553DRAFT_277827 [Filobasidium floriforme]KAG7532068.1 hypothetical protein FFLO_03876 [Filobasidium floriforme]KAH8078600.1 hypothetical protein HD553DRAFT_277827 [Filobasidium floriforme]
MGKHKHNRLYVTHDEHAAGLSSGSVGKQAPTGTGGFQRLPFDCCALSLQPFKNPVAAIGEGNRADVFDLLNIVPYIRKYGTNPATGTPLTTNELVKLNFFKNAEGSYHDPITYKPLSQHTHIVFLKTTGNVYDMSSLHMLAIKTKTFRDLIDESPFTKSDVVTIQDPENLGARDLSSYDYVKSDKRVEETDRASDPLRGINVDAAGGAGKVLRMVAQKSKAAEDLAKATSSEANKTPEEGLVAIRPKAQKAYNASNFTNGQASASFTSTSLAPAAKNETAMFDEEEYMFDEMSKVTKEKERIQYKGYATIRTNLGNLNVELHGDRAPKTVYNWIKLAQQGKYDDVVFHRLIPGFMIQGGDPTGTGRGGSSFWGNNFRDEHDLKGAYKHSERGVLSMANRGPNTNGSQFFFTFRPTPHLDGKHTVFGKLVDDDSLQVLSLLETQPVAKKGDAPAEEIKILGIVIVQDPFQTYQDRLNAKISRQDQSEDALALRAAKKAAREADRTTWLGTDLGEKGKRKLEDDGDAAVGKYLASKKQKPPAPSVTNNYDFGGASAKKPKKLGSFGDFSGW